MKALITGGTGFLGKHLKDALENQNYEVTGLGSKDCDLTREDSLKDYLRGERFDKVFHLAAWTQAGDFCLYHPGEQWIINQKINTNVLSWWKENQPQAKMISMGTSCAYDPSLELKEENYMKGVPIDSLFAYAQTKRMLYAGLTSFNRQFGLEYLCAVPSTLYGPGYHMDGRQMHFIFDLMRKVLEKKFYDKEITLWGDGTQKREIVYIDDFIENLLKTDKIVKNDLINMGAGEEYTIRQFAGILCELTGVDPSSISYDTTKYVGAKSKCLDIGKMKNILGNPKKTHVKEGLKKTLDWMTENRDGILLKKD